jgi:PKD repeat protein
LIKNLLVIGIIVLFIGTNIVSISGNQIEHSNDNACILKTVDNSKRLLACDHLAYLGAGGIYEFILNDPGNLTLICNGDGNGPGALTLDGRLLICEFYNGALWEIDLATCETTEIGGGGTGMNGLTCDPTTNQLYGASGNGATGGLWKIDQDTGEQEYIGDFVSTAWMIGIACNLDGVLYGWDISPDYLYTIDKETGEATQVGPLGFDLSYQQDGAFCLEDNILYLAAFTSSPQYGSYLLKCDENTGECTIIGQFEGNVEANWLVIPYNWLIPFADFTWTPANPDPGETILFDASDSVDYDGNIILYEWDWNNDGIFDENHTSPTATHTFGEVGYYPVTLRVTDNDNLKDSKTKTVRVGNHPPTGPIIDGLTHGKVGVEYQYNFSLFDPDDDIIYLRVDWGNGTSGPWQGPYDSDTTVKLNHTWNQKGTFIIKAQVKDIFDAESDWTSFEVIIFKSKAINYNSLFFKVVEKFPFLQKLIDIIERYK